MEDDEIDLLSLDNPESFIFSNDNKCIKGGKLVKIKPEFTDNPLPEELLFDGYEKFFHILPSFGYFDQEFCNDTLERNYEKSLALLHKQRNACERFIIKYETELEEAQSQNIEPQKIVLSYLNRQYWQEAGVLKATEKKLHIRLLKKRIQAYQKTIILFNKLIQIIQELQERMRYIAFLYSSVHSVMRTLSVEFESKLQFKLKATRLTLSDRKMYIRLFPCPFLDLVTARTHVIQIINSCQKYIDPATHYLCETSSTPLFADFMKSECSPLKAIEAKYSIEKDAEKVIHSSIRGICQFTQNSHPSYVELLSLLVSRFWFSYSLYSKHFMRHANPQFQQKLIQLRSKCINQMNPPKSCLALFNKEITPVDFFHSTPFLEPSIDSFDSCLFMYAPEDIMNEFRLIHLRFAGYLATQLKTDINGTVAQQGIGFLWKLLFIVSAVPNVDGIITFIETYYRMKCYPKELSQTIEYPIVSKNDLLNNDM